MVQRRCLSPGCSVCSLITVRSYIDDVVGILAIGLIEPIYSGFFQTLGDGRIGRCHIMLLVEVGGHIVKFSPGTVCIDQQLPLALPDCDMGTHPVGLCLTELPEERCGALPIRLPGNNITHIYTVKRVVGRNLSSCYLTKRRKEVNHADNRLVILYTYRNMVRPSDDERHSNTTFVECTFLTTEVIGTMAVKIRSRTIVTRKDDNGILVNAQILKPLHETPNLAIEFCQYDG